jgi:flagellar hook assembly protein FlgD
LIIFSKPILEAYPNPFNPMINFSFTLEKFSKVEIKILNIKGQLVSSIKEGFLNSGKHIISWQSINLASGIYFAQLQANNEILDTNKIILIK